MKHYILTGLLLAGLAGCAKKESDPSPTPAPAPTLTGGAWIFKSEASATTPKSGGSTTTSSTTVAPGSATLTFTDATHYTVTSAGLTGAGTYTYSANTINSVPDNGAPVAIPPKFTVSELTTNKLVLVENSEDATNRYTHTSTLAR
jgi:hypothetical protein